MKPATEPSLLSSSTNLSSATVGVLAGRGVSPHTRHKEPDLLVFSHLRWDFVFQRPQHLLSRFAKERRVFYIEEPVYHEKVEPRIRTERRDNGLLVLTPELPSGTSELDAWRMQKWLVDEALNLHNVRHYLAWYYTPMAYAFSNHLRPLATIYDCMDELSLFHGAHPRLLDLEQEVLHRADVMFTGGQSLYEHKRDRHRNVHAFPSSIDKDHFAAARNRLEEPSDQSSIPHLRIGFAGVIDERLDIRLLRGAAELRPDWHFVMIGPVVKIDPATLPQLPNIHYLGSKPYAELPRYISSWDAAMLPFARNDSTRFISPTKTPEYLAAGRPVVSTSIRDVVKPYGERGLVEIADTPQAFVEAVERALEKSSVGGQWLQRVDEFLAQNSWDKTWSRMRGLIDAALDQKVQRRAVLDAI